MNEKQGLDSLRDLIIADILNGRLPAGGWLKQIDLEETYGASRSLVRRALDDLSARNYVQHVKNRGYKIAVSSSKYRDELREVRLALETYSSQNIVENCAPTDLAILRKLAEDFAEAVKNGTPKHQIDANSKFHESLYELEKNQVLRDLMKDMHRRAIAHVAMPWQSMKQMKQAAREHFDIVNALELKDAGKYKMTIAKHIMRARNQAM